MANPSLLVRSRQALGWTQRQLGENLGSSHRTATRWESGASTIYPDTTQKLARFVHPVDRELAAELAAALGESLVSLGLEAPPVAPVAGPPAPPLAPPLAPPPRPEALRDLIEAVVCAVADAANVAPKVVRPSVLLTLRRTLEVGLDVKAAGAAGLFGTTGV